jgi:hypothetical protein
MNIFSVVSTFCVALALCALLLAPTAPFAQTGAPDASSPNKSGAPDVAAPNPSTPTTPTPNAAVPNAPPPNAPAPSPATPPKPGAALPLKPGAVRITTRAPEPDKWDAQRSANGLQRVFKCKPLACSDAESISFTFLKSPTAHPDPQALEKFAKIDLPKSIRAADAAREVLTDGTEKIETVSSKTATLKDYPAVINESKFSRGKMSVYLNTAIIFAGPVMIRVQSSSQNRDLAQKTLSQFVEVMRIEQAPPRQPGSPQPAISGAEEL